MYECECPDCKGKRLNDKTLSCKINGYSIYDMCEMEFNTLREVINDIKDERATTITSQLIADLDRMIDIGLPYLFMIRESTTLSGGEAQRLKLVRYMGSSLCGMIYIFDEPSTGMHPRDVHRMSRLLKNLRDKGNIYILDEPTTGLHMADIEKVVDILEGIVDIGNTVIVIEHNTDVMKLADYIIDVGPDGGTKGGKIVFTGTPREMYDNAETITAKYLRKA